LPIEKRFLHVEGWLEHFRFRPFGRLPFSFMSLSYSAAGSSRCIGGAGGFSRDG
jgi:hypothetical protein